MAFTDDQKVQIRRHLGYPVIGNPLVSPAGGATLASGFQGYSFFQVYGLLEFRMNWLQPVEAAVITGLATAVVTVAAVPNGVITTGGVVGLEVISGDADVTVSYLTMAGDTVYSVAQALAALINSSPILQSLNFEAFSPLSIMSFGDRQPPASSQPYPGVQISSPNEFSMVFTPPVDVLMSGSNNAVAKLPSPTSIIDEVEYHGYLPVLDKLEGDLLRSTENLDTEKADVWTARVDEVQARQDLYNRWRQRLADFLDIPLYEKTGYSVRTRGSASGFMVA